VIKQKAWKLSLPGFFYLVGVLGFEPRTLWSQTRKTDQASI
jgi:hypothetical protein